MTPRAHLWLCLLAAFLILWLTYTLDVWVLAAAERSTRLMDGSFALAKALARICAALLVVVLSWLVLHRPPRVLVACSYFAIGAYLTLYLPLVLFSVSSPAQLPPPLLLSLSPVVKWLGPASDIFSFACASVLVLGIVTFIRRYALSQSDNA